MKNKWYTNKFIRILPKLNLNQMAQLVKLMSSDDKQISRFENCIVDACNSHTILYDLKGNVKVRILDSMDNIDIDLNRIRLNYSSGAYLLVKAW